MSYLIGAESRYRKNFLNFLVKLAARHEIILHLKLTGIVALLTPINITTTTTTCKNNQNFKFIE